MFLFIHYYSKHFLNVYRNARKKEQMFYLFLFSNNYGGLVWVLLLFFLSHTHYSILLWVSLLLFCSHTHYSILLWVSHLLFCSHTHYGGLLWVSLLLFYSHTHIGARNKTSYEAQAEINKTTASPKNATFSEVYRYTIVIFPCFVI